MDNVELSPATRWGMIATGLLQGLVYRLACRKKSQLDCLWRACDRRVFIRFTLLRDLF